MLPDRALALVRHELERLVRRRRSLARTRARLDGPGGTGCAALDVALEALDRAESALGQAEEELEIADGLYLTGTPLA